MKIDYNILWLDDKKSDIIEDNYAEELQNFIENEGFEPNINLVSNEEEFFKNLILKINSSLERIGQSQLLAILKRHSIRSCFI